MTGAGKPLAIHTSVMLSYSDTEVLLFSNGLLMVAGAAIIILYYTNVIIMCYNVK